MELHIALKQRKSKLVIDELNNNNVNTNTRNEEGLTLLQVAAREGLYDVVLTLLYHDAEINRAEGQTQSPLLLAYENGHSIVVQILLACGASNQHETVQGLTLNPAVMRAVLFWTILNTETTNLLLQLQPQIEVSRDSEASGSEGSNIQVFFQRELSSFIKLCLDLKKTTLAIKLMDIAGNIQAKFYNPDTVISIYTSNETVKHFKDAFANKDYCVLHQLLQQPIDRYQLLTDAIHSRNGDLECFIILSMAFSPYAFSLQAVKQRDFLNEYLSRKDIAQSVLYQVVSLHIPINSTISKEAYHLFQLLPQDKKTKHQVILKCIYDHRPYPSIARLLPDDNAFENNANTGLSLSMHALVREKFLRFGIDIPPHAAAGYSGDKKLPNDLWKSIFTHLNRAEQKNVNAVSRFFHQLIIEPGGRNLYRSTSIHHKLLILNNFLVAIENERQQGPGCIDKMKAKKVLTASTMFTGVIVGVFSYFTRHYFEIHSSLKKELSTITVGDSTCDHYYEDNGRKCFNPPDVCQDLCDYIEKNKGPTAGVLVPLMSSSVLFLVLFIILLRSFNDLEPRDYIYAYSDETQQLAEIMFTDNAGHFQANERLASIITQAQRIKTRLEQELQTIASHQVKEKSDERLAPSVSAIGI